MPGAPVLESVPASAGVAVRDRERISCFTHGRHYRGAARGVITEMAMPVVRRRASVSAAGSLTKL